MNKFGTMILSLYRNIIIDDIKYHIEICQHKHVTEYFKNWMTIIIYVVIIVCNYQNETGEKFSTEI